MLISEIRKFLYENNVLIATNGFMEFPDDIIHKSFNTYKDIITYNLYKQINFICVPCSLFNLNCLTFLFNYCNTEYNYSDIAYKRNKYDYIIYIDSDCFIHSIENLYKLFYEFLNGDYVVGGVLENSLLSHRHGPKYSINPFMSFYNMKIINKMELFKEYNNVNEFNVCRFNHVINNRNKYLEYNNISNNYSDKCVNNDIHHKLYLSLCDKKMMYFYARDCFECDNIATNVYCDSDIQTKKNLVCTHSWYSRDYMYKSVCKQRIDKIYNWCVSRE